MNALSIEETKYAVLSCMEERCDSSLIVGSLEEHSLEKFALVGDGLPLAKLFKRLSGSLDGLSVEFDRVQAVDDLVEGAVGEDEHMLDGDPDLGYRTSVKRHANHTHSHEQKPVFFTSAGVLLRGRLPAAQASRPPPGCSGFETTSRLLRRRNSRKVGGDGT